MHHLLLLVGCDVYVDLVVRNAIKNYVFQLLLISTVEIHTLAGGELSLGMLGLSKIGLSIDFLDEVVLGVAKGIELPS